MKKLLHCSLLVLFITTSMSFTSGKDNDENSNILGSWEYIAPSAMLGYQQGIVSFEFENNKLVGVVSLKGETYSMRKLIHEENKVRAFIIVDGSQVDLYIKFYEDSFEATVSNSYGYMRVSGHKKSRKIYIN